MNLKPNDRGFQRHKPLHCPSAGHALASALAALEPGDWLAEERLVGRELSVGVLGGRAMGVVEIRPKSGVYDYASKYTKGMTEYFAPAALDAAMTRKKRSPRLRRPIWLADVGIMRGWTLYWL